MKNLFIISIVFFALCVGFTACGGDKPDPPSPECDIISFNAGGKEWEIIGNEIRTIFPKGTPVNNLSPVIRVSDKCTVSPASGVPQDFSNGKEVKYTVTAGDCKKDYTAKATVSVSN